MKVSPNIIKTEITEPFCKEALKHLVYYYSVIIIIITCIIRLLSNIF